MTALIIDDMTIARAIINQLTFEVGDLTIICKSCTATEAYQHVEDKSIGLLYPSHKMSDPTGLELTGNVRKKDTVLVFITTGKDAGCEEMNPAVTDYMISAHGSSRFLPLTSGAKRSVNSRQIDVVVQQHERAAVQQQQTAIQQSTALQQHGTISPGNEECVFIRDNSVIRRLKLDDIQYAEAMGDYVKFHTTKKMYTIHCTLKSVEQRLSAANFIRVHRSYIVALNKLDSMQDGGLVIGDRFIPVADNYRKLLYQRMNIL
jgi:DNA-binding LytR/AlgR family response regulator